MRPPFSPIAPARSQRACEGDPRVTGENRDATQRTKGRLTGLVSPRPPLSRLRFLHNNRRDNATAFTLVELMIVVAIIGILASLAIPAFAHVVFRAQLTKAITDIKAIEADVGAFEMENNRIPNDLTEINRNTLKDPWGNPYQYLSFAAAGPSWKGSARKDHSLVPINSTFDLYSMGADGKTAGPITAKASLDDIVRANDGGFIGLASEF